MIGLAALVTGEHNRRGQWRRILIATGAALAFEAGGLALINLIAKNAALATLLYANLAVGLIVPTIVLGRGGKFLPRRRSASRDAHATPL